MVIAFCSRESLAQRKGIIGVCILVITIREPGKKKKKRQKKTYYYNAHVLGKKAPACSFKGIKNLSGVSQAPMSAGIPSNTQTAYISATSLYLGQFLVAIQGAWKLLTPFMI